MRQSFKPMEGAKMSDTPFQGNTDYHDSYVQHPLQPKFVQEKEQYKPSGAPLDGLTTNRKDYRGFPGSRMQSFKPDNQAFQSEAPLDDVTTNRKDYQRWETQRPYQHPAEQYKPPEGQMESQTTSNATYRPMPLVRTQAIRPNSGRQGPDVPFEGRTSYKSDYPKWEAERVLARQKEGYVPNQAPFQGDPTYRAHYKPHQVAPARSFRPDNAAFQSQEPFNDQTMYKGDYTPKQIQICEAAIIDQGRSRYKFFGMDERGHRLYGPVSETVTPIGGQDRSLSQQRLAMSVA